jgi:hypothetical protein
VFERVTFFFNLVYFISFLHTRLRSHTHMKPQALVATFRAQNGMSQNAALLPGSVIILALRGQAKYTSFVGRIREV